LLLRLSLPRAAEDKQRTTSSIPPDAGCLADLDRANCRFRLTFPPTAIAVCAGKVRIVSPCTAEMFAWVRYAPGSDAGTRWSSWISICVMSGAISVAQMRGSAGGRRHVIIRKSRSLIEGHLRRIVRHSQKSPWPRRCAKRSYLLPLHKRPCRRSGKSRQLLLCGAEYSCFGGGIFRKTWCGSLLQDGHRLGSPLRDWIASTGERSTGRVFCAVVRLQSGHILHPNRQVGKQ